jgi:hypothetical protein
MIPPLKILLGGGTPTKLRTPPSRSDGLFKEHAKERRKKREK